MGGTIAGLGLGGGWLALGAAGQAELTPPGYGWALAKMLGALILVCVVAYLVLHLLRRQLQAARRLGPAALRIVERLPLSSRHSVYLVEVAGRYFLLGAGDGAAPSRLAELEPETIRRVDGEGGAPRRSFWQILHGARQVEPPRSEGEERR